MKFNPTAITLWAFLAIIFHLCGGSWLVGLAFGLGISLLSSLLPSRR